MIGSTNRTGLGRPSPAMVVACIALFLGLSGVGYAAAKIGSAQIKNNSVQGKDIKNKTIKTGDISKGTIDSLKGQNGAQGAQGAQGAKGTTGAPGPRGIVAPLVAAPVGFPNIPPTDAGVPIVQLVVPAGKYLVTGKFNLETGDDDSTMTCNLRNNATTVDTVETYLATEDSDEAVSMLAQVTVTTGPLRIQCFHDGLNPGPGGSAAYIKLAAIPVS